MNLKIFKLGILASHPVQYQVPLFRELAQLVDLKVYFAHKQSAEGQAISGFNTAFEWDIDLFEGYDYQFLKNIAKNPSTDRFFGCDTPEIRQIIRDGGFDAFLVSGWYLMSQWQAVLACKKFGVPVLVRGDSQLDSPRGIIKKLLKKIIYPAILHQFDAFLYVGKKNLEYLKHYGVPSIKLFYSPHCIDNEYFANLATNKERERLRNRLGILEKTPLILFAGKLIPIKKPLDVLKGASCARKAGIPVEVLVAGSGPLENSMRECAEELGVPLHLLGFCNQSEMPAAYAAADVLVLPSKSETWGLVVNEALACGRPVVVSDTVGCAPDLAKDGVAGRTFPCGNTIELGRSLIDVLKQPKPIGAITKVVEAHSIKEATAGVLAALEFFKQIE